MTKPTLPWSWDGTYPITIQDSEGYYVVSPGGMMPSGEGNAKFLIRACNSHAELLEALRNIGIAPCIRALLGESDDSPCWCPSCRAKAAIAKAEGEK